jgi:hypothetical protein
VLFNPQWRDDGGGDGFNVLADRCNTLNYAVRDAHRADPGLDLQQSWYLLNCTIVLLQVWSVGQPLDTAEQYLREAEWAFTAALDRRRGGAVHARY